MYAILMSIIAGLCWGVGEVCTKSALHSGTIGPVTAVAVRSTIALPIMWLVYLALVQGWRMEPTDWLRGSDAPTMLKIILGSGLAAGAGGMIFFYLALSCGDISRVKPIAFTLAPATAVVLGWLVLGEAMSLRKAIALVLVLAGVILLSVSPENA